MVSRSVVWSSLATRTWTSTKLSVHYDDVAAWRLYAEIQAAEWCACTSRSKPEHIPATPPPALATHRLAPQVV